MTKKKAAAGDAQARSVRFSGDMDSLRITASKPMRVREAGYGWAVDEGAYSEWALVLQFTARQDGKTSWLVALTMVDGAVETRDGLSPSARAFGEMEAAINSLTADWIQPLNAPAAPPAGRPPKTIGDVLFADPLLAPHAALLGNPGGLPEANALTWSLRSECGRACADMAAHYAALRGHFEHVTGADDDDLLVLNGLARAVVRQMAVICHG